MNTIRFVPSSVHGIFDYIGGIALIACPFIFGFYSMGSIAHSRKIINEIALILSAISSKKHTLTLHIRFTPSSLSQGYDASFENRMLLPFTVCSSIQTWNIILIQGEQ